MRNNIRYGLFIFLILFGVVSCEHWKFKECKKVGHGTLYCILKIGND